MHIGVVCTYLCVRFYGCICFTPSDLPPFLAALADGSQEELPNETKCIVDVRDVARCAVNDD